MGNIHALNDFSRTGTRVVTAADYAYQIKRLVHPLLHTPIAGVMDQYIVGLKEYAATLEAAAKAHPDDFLDLNRYPLPGVSVVDDTTYRITIYGKYPQFAYWLAMPFFSPMPQEAERFYALPGMRERNLSLDWWPVGSGPYYLSENDPNRRMVLTRNPYYDSERYPDEGEPGDAQAGLLADAGKPLPLIGQRRVLAGKRDDPVLEQISAGLLRRVRHQFGQFRPGGAGRRWTAKPMSATT